MGLSSPAPRSRDSHALVLPTLAISVGYLILPAAIDKSPECNLMGAPCVRGVRLRRPARMGLPRVVSRPFRRLMSIGKRGRCAPAPQHTKRAPAGVLWPAAVWRWSSGLRQPARLGLPRVVWRPFSSVCEHWPAGFSGITV
jgi:hypothetical protein